MAVDPHINPATGVWDDNYYANLNKGSSGGGGSSAPDYAAIAREQMKMMQEANKPAVESLQASIPEIQSKYAQTGEYLQKQVGTLDERYKNLLDSIKGQQTQATQRTSIEQSREMGKRGISSESGYYGQAMNQVLNPINEYYAGQLKDTGIQQQSALDSLLNMISGNTQAQTSETRAVQNAIAQLQAGGAASGITNALQMYQQQQAATEAQKQRDLQLQIAQMGQTSGGSNQDRYITIGDGAMLLDTQTGQIIENKKSFAGGGSSGDNGW